jgi:heme-degrading monooxygenase HmoA
MHQVLPCAIALLLGVFALQTHAFQVLSTVGTPARLAAARVPLLQGRTKARYGRRAYLSSIKAAASTDVDESSTAVEGLLGRERYVVFNRFQARDGAGPRFEKRWADRKSSLSTLEGFRFFSLLRRADDVELNGKLVTYEEGTPDYQSMTVWETKKNFNSWRTGYAFKEAHGGGSLGGFLSAMVGSMMVLKTTPVPAMWDALEPISTPTQECRLALRNRDPSGKAVTDGSKPLPRECFVAMNRFPVKAEHAKEFEERWAQRESKLQGQSGFVGFMLMRRDRPSNAKGKGGGMKDDKYNYSTCTIWASKDDWDAWRKGEGTHSHAAAQKKVESGEQQPVSELLEAPASPIFWEGVLALQSEVGM